MKSVRTPRTLGRVPNQPKTQHRSVRVDDADWADLERVAKAMGMDRAKVINAYVRYFLRRPGATLPERPTPQQIAALIREEERDPQSARAERNELVHDLPPRGRRKPASES